MPASWATRRILRLGTDQDGQDDARRSRFDRALERGSVAGMHDGGANGRKAFAAGDQGVVLGVAQCVGGGVHGTQFRFALSCILHCTKILKELFADSAVERAPQPCAASRRPIMAWRGAAVAAFRGRGGANRILPVGRNDALLQRHGTPRGPANPRRGRAGA